jgi:hypothetical protein
MHGCPGSGKKTIRMSGKDTGVSLNNGVFLREFFLVSRTSLKPLHIPEDVTFQNLDSGEYIFCDPLKSSFLIQPTGARIHEAMKKLVISRFLKSYFKKDWNDKPLNQDALRFQASEQRQDSKSSRKSKNDGVRIAL